MNSKSTCALGDLVERSADWAALLRNDRVQGERAKWKGFQRAREVRAGFPPSERAVKELEMVQSGGLKIVKIV